MESLKEKPADLIDLKQIENPEKTVDDAEDLQVKSKDEPEVVLKEEFKEEPKARKANDEDETENNFDLDPKDPEVDQDEKLKSESTKNQEENPDDEFKDEHEENLKSQEIPIEKFISEPQVILDEIPSDEELFGHPQD